MDIRSAGEQIKGMITMDQILSTYGYKTKGKKMLCPFHADKNESLNVFDNKGWYCFGCLKGGSVIDFVMEQENCDYSTAVRAIDHHFRLGLLVPGDPLKYDMRTHYKRELKKIISNLNEQISIIQSLIEIDLAEKTRRMQDISSKQKRDITADEWTEALALKEEMEYLEYKLKRCDEIREEVREWHRKKILEQTKL